MLSAVRGVAVGAALVVAVAGCTSGTTGSPAGTSSPRQSTAAAHGSSSASGAATPSGIAFLDPSDVQAVTAAATTAIATINSYDYRELSADLQRALAVSTGSLRGTLSTTFSGTIDPQAPAAKAVQVATVTHVGVASLDSAAGRATLLVIGQLSVTNVSTGATPKLDPFGVVAQLAKVAGRWLVSSYNTDSASSSTATTEPGTPEVTAALAAGKREAANIITFSRATFASDFQRALDGATGSLRSDLAGQRAATLSAMTSGHFDLKGTEIAAGIESLTSSEVTLVVTVNGNKVGSGAAQSSASLQRLELTMTLASGVWLASSLSAIGIQ